MTTQLSIPDLLARLNQVDESHDIEAKKSETELGKSALESIVAFANEPGLGGGYLLFGAEEVAPGRFTARGVRNAKKLEQELSTICATSLNRTIRPRVWIDVIEGASLVAAFIPESSPAEKPIFIASKGVHHGTFRRVGSTDQRCTEDDLRVLFRASDALPYEDALVPGASEADLAPEVIAAYRRQLLDENPATELRDASGMELVQAVGGCRREGGVFVPTVAGVLLFGTRLALRRLFPALRVDYIRVQGTEWVPDADHRYQSVDVREPLLLAFRRVYAAVIDDLPKSFALVAGSPERRDQLALPESAVREAIVNALTHRDYRAPSAVQIIRYQDRIEVRNPGHSLVDDEQFGEPGSAARNPRIATVFRDMRLAENKGTGIAAIRRAMQRAGLTTPLFDSDRTKNQFVVTLFLHNLVDGEDTDWLQRFQSTRLSDHQATALVVARRTGTITNAMLRDLSGLDTLAASGQLRELRDAGLLEPRGRGSATHYVLTAAARGQVVEPSTVGGVPGQTGGLARQTGELTGQTGGLTGQIGQLTGQTGGLTGQTGGLTEQTEGLTGQTEGLLREGAAPSAAELMKRLPAQIAAAVTQVGGKPAPADLRRVIVEVCTLGWWTPRDLTILLGRKDLAHLSETHLSALVKEGSLERRYPTTPSHPRQAYRTRQANLPIDNPNDPGEP